MKVRVAVRPVEGVTHQATGVGLGLADLSVTELTPGSPGKAEKVRPERVPYAARRRDGYPTLSLLMETARAGRGRGSCARRVASVMPWQRISFSALRAAGTSVSA